MKRKHEKEHVLGMIAKMDVNEPLDNLDKLRGKIISRITFFPFSSFVQTLKLTFRKCFTSLLSSGIPSEELFEKLLSDSAFVEYLNTFLSLPVSIN